MVIDLVLLRSETEQLLREWDAGKWSGTGDALANPGGVAERCLGLISEVERLRSLLDSDRAVAN